MATLSHSSEERTCPVCGSRSYLSFAEERIDPGKITEFSYASRKQPEYMCLRLVHCADCDLVYAPSPPSAEYLSTAYAEADYDSSQEAQAAARTYAQALRPYVDKLPGRQAAVDVGAGSGPLLPWLRESGFNPVIGIEPSRAAIAASPPTVRPMLLEGMFSPDLLSDISISLLCSFMTLEHLSDPARFAKTAFQLLEPGGMLAVVVHNWRAPVNRLLGLRSPIIDLEHLQLFSPRSIHCLLSDTGFVSIRQHSISNAYTLGYWLRLTPLPVKLKMHVADILDSLGLSDNQIRLPVGNMLAIGIKPVK